MTFEGNLRGAAFVVRDEKDRVVKVVFVKAQAVKLSRKRGWSFEIVPNALTEAAIELIAGKS